MIGSVIHFIQGGSASNTIQNIFWIIPLVQIIHILAISVVVASMAMLDCRLMGLVGTRHSISRMSGRFLPWLWPTLVVLLVTGIILIIGEPERSLGNPVFQIKMVLVALVACISLAFQSMLKRHASVWDRAPRPPLVAWVTGFVSLLLWISIVTAGRFIAYVM